MSFSNSSPPRSRTVGRGGSLVMVGEEARGAGKAQPLRPQRRQDWTNSATCGVITPFGWCRQRESGWQGAIFRVLCTKLRADSCCGKQAASHRRGSADAHARVVPGGGAPGGGTAAGWGGGRASDRNRVWAGDQRVGPKGGGAHFPGQGAASAQSHHCSCRKHRHGASLRRELARLGEPTG